jgi:DegV family protein with EDD domain
MQIVTDRASDITAEQMEGLDIHFAPMHLTLDGKTYSSGEDLMPEEFYELLEHTSSLPVTSQATSGDFTALYRRLAQTDPEILSIHISSGLSGTIDSARLGAKSVPEAHVTFWDTKTLSGPEAWQVEAAARDVKAGLSLEQIFKRLERIRAATEGIFTVETLKYLIHGGRISHLKGLVASLLQIRPVIGVEKDSGKYYTLAQERTSKRAIQKLAESLRHFYPEGSLLRAQLLHGNNLPGAALLREAVEGLFQCHWLPTVSVGPILGAHTGPSLIGMSVAPAEVFATTE